MDILVKTSSNGVEVIKMELNYSNIVERFRKSSQQWIMPIPVIQDGKLVVFCFMRHDKENRIADDEPIYFDSYYAYRTSLLVLHNFLLETSCGQAYWKYVRCKEPRTDFKGLIDKQTNSYFDEKFIKNLMINNKTEYVFNNINEKFKDINHDFTTHSKDDDIEKEFNELKDMGYD